MKTPLRIVLVLAGATALLVLVPQLQREKPAPDTVTPSPTAAPAEATAASTPTLAAELAAGLTFPATPQPRPLPVSQSSAHHQWTAGDGLSPDTLQQIAQNADEFIRLIEENDRILRRQLVYRQDVAAAAVQRSRLSGQPIRTLILPGLDGAEYELEVTGTDLSPSGQTGTFTGHLAGAPDSLVTLAFRFGREAFTVLSPSTGVFLQGHPRTSGEIIVTSFDPAGYTPQPGGEPILTQGD